MNQYDDFGNNDPLENHQTTKTRQLNKYDSKGNLILSPNSAQTNKLEHNDPDKKNGKRTRTRKLNQDDKPADLTAFDDELLNPAKKQKAEPLPPADQPPNKSGLDLDFSKNTSQQIRPNDVADDLRKYKLDPNGAATNPLNFTDAQIARMQNPASTVAMEELDD